MNEGLKRLPRSRLQSFIGEELLQRLETLLPAVSDREVDLTDLYKKDALATVVNAFSGERILSNQNYRQDLLNHQTEDVLNRIIFRTDLNTQNCSFKEKVESIVNKGWSDPNFAVIVLDELGLSRSNAPTVHEETSQQEIVQCPNSPFKSLKDFQLPVFMKAKSGLAAPRNRFIVQMPTGSGKTRTAMEVIADHLNEAEEGSVVVWLAHSGELCEQAHAAFREVWEHIGHYDAMLARLWGQVALSDFHFHQRAFVVASFKKAHSLTQNNSEVLESLRKRVGLIIVDEAHKAIAPTYKRVIKRLTNDDTKIIGLTATPGRSAFDAKENQELSDFFFGNIVEIETPEDENVISYLRKREVLAEATYDPLISGRSYRLEQQEKNRLERFFDFPSGFLSKVAEDDVRNVEIVKRVDTELRNKRKVLLFACSVEHSQFLCGCLNFLGWKAGHIDGQIGYGRRAGLINDFKEGNLQVLTNYGVLSTGFDVPLVDVILIARPTASVVLYSQMIGRGLRGPAIGGTEWCKIIDVLDNIEGYSDEEKVYDYFSDFWS